MPREATDVAIIGAGPYGLSIAAHLSARKVAFRIFGTPMSSWRHHMAAGTFLKSFGFASCLYDPGSTFTFAHYCQVRGIHYDDVVTPVALEKLHCLRVGVSASLRPQPRADRHRLAASFARRLRPDHANRRDCPRAPCHRRRWHHALRLRPACLHRPARRVRHP